VQQQYLSKEGELQTVHTQEAQMYHTDMYYGQNRALVTADTTLTQQALDRNSGGTWI
jgi:hypothetical protein